VQPYRRCWRLMRWRRTSRPRLRCCSHPSAWWQLYGTRKHLPVVYGLLQLPTTVWLLGLVNFCNDSASALVNPPPLCLVSIVTVGPQV
jgi:hypothetical protein